MYKIKTYKTFDDEKLKKSWQNLCLENNYCLQNSYQWALIWWNNFRNKSRELFIVAVEDGDSIVGIGPFMIEKNMFLKELKFIGSGLTDFHDVLAAADQDEDILKSMLEFLSNSKKYSIINLEQVSQDSKLFKVINQNSSFKKREMVKCPIANFNSISWDEYRKKLSGKFRRNWNWGFNKLNISGDLKFLQLRNFNEKREYLEKIFDLHIKRWKYKKKGSKFDQNIIRNFISELILSMPEIEIYILLFNNEMISYWIGFSHDGVFYGWNTSFDTKYYKYSVGQILTGLLIKYLIENNYKKFNFMRGDEDYKRKWMTDDEMLINYQFLSKIKPLSGYIGIKYYLVWKWMIKNKFKIILEKPFIQKILIKLRY
ncbi:MAG: GNAT family N-acetyltransferase [Promethearchaeota archaeon]